MSKAIQCTASFYGCEPPEDMQAASITLHPDNDGNGLYVRIRDDGDASPMAGLDLTIGQAERLVEALKWALADAHVKRVTAYAKSREAKP